LGISKKIGNEKSSSIETVGEIAGIRSNERNSMMKSIIYHYYSQKYIKIHKTHIKKITLNPQQNNKTTPKLPAIRVRTENGINKNNYK
jgi:hypothetical protein